MADATWKESPANGYYNDPNNWLSGEVPGQNDTAFFAVSSETSITVTSDLGIGGWTFDSDAPAYSFAINTFSLSFYGAGIITAGADVEIAITE